MVDATITSGQRAIGEEPRKLRIQVRILSWLQIKTMGLFLAKYKDIDFMLSDDKLSEGDKFVFVNPSDPTDILTNTETLKFDKIDFRKVVWAYDKTLKDYPVDDIIYTMSEAKEL